MPVDLEGSCRCGSVRFSIASHTPVPYMLCYCSICRKTGGSGYAINIMGRADTLRITGRDRVATFRADAAPGKTPCDRQFCRDCGSALWVTHPDWPELVHPFASAIDSDLPVPPDHVHMMLGSKAPWVEPVIGSGDTAFPAYPELSIEDWHKSRGLWVD